MQDGLQERLDVDGGKRSATHGCGVVVGDVEPALGVVGGLEEVLGGVRLPERAGGQWFHPPRRKAKDGDGLGLSEWTLPSRRPA